MNSIESGFGGSGVGVLVAVAVAEGAGVGVDGSGAGVSIEVGSGVKALGATRAGCGRPPQAESKADRTNTTITQ